MFVKRRKINRRIHYELMLIFWSFLCPILLLAQTTKESIEILKTQINQTKSVDENQIELLRQISDYYLSINIDSAKLYGSKAINLCIKLKKDSLLPSLYLSQGANFLWSWNIEAADSYLKKGESFAIKFNDLNSLFYIYSTLSNMYVLNHIWDEAWVYAQKSKEVSEKIEQDSMETIAFAYAAFADVYRGVRDYKKADEYFLKANNAFSDERNLYQRYINSLEYAKMLVEFEHFDSAKLYLQQALDYFINLDETIQIADVYETYGKYFNATNQIDSALSYYDSAKIIYAKDSLVKDLNRLRLRMGQCFFKQKKYEAAKANALESYYFFKSENNNFLLLDCLELLHNIEMKENPTSTNGQYFSEYIEVNSKVTDQGRLFRTRELITQYELAQKEKENQKLKIKYQYQQDRFWLITISSILILITGVILFVLYRKNKTAYQQVAHLQQITEEKNVSLSQTITIKERLMSMLAHDVRSPVTSLENMLILSRDKLITTEEFAQLSDLLLVETTHLKGMLDNTLLWANQQTSSIKIQKKAIAVFPLIQSIIEIYKPGILLKKLNLQNAIPKGTIINTDPDVFHIIFRNILSNAIKFTPSEKSIIISCINSGSKITIQVMDEGVGMDEQVLEKINSGTIYTTRGTENEKGSGLGISFIKELVKKSGDTFEVISTPTKGTTVSICFLDN